MYPQWKTSLAKDKAFDNLFLNSDITFLIWAVFLKRGRIHSQKLYNSMKRNISKNMSIIKFLF
jgi:hypothetical protein